MPVFIKTTSSILLWGQGLKRRRNRREALQATSRKTYPDASITVFKQGYYVVFREAVGISQRMFVANKPVVFAIELQQAKSLLCKPEVSMAIFQHRIHASVTRA